MKKLKLFTILFCAGILVANAQYSEGILDNIKIASPSIKGNVFGDDMNQDVAVYLPPTYNTKTDKRYPVLYFLCGYYDKVETWTKTGEFQGFKLKDNLDKLINEGILKEMIVVIPNSYTFLEGSFFTNSNVNGNYEDFYTNELVNYIDANYRTIASRNARGIAGHSMGGSGALDLSMKHADIYCMAYGLCSGLLAPNWVEESPVFVDTANIINSIEFFQSLDALSKADAHQQYVNRIEELRATDYGWVTIFGYAYGAAFAGDSSLKAPYFKYPFSIKNDELITDTAILANWEKGFGNLENKITTYKDNLLSLKAYVLDYGSTDYWKYIISGHLYYHDLLIKAQVPHIFNDNGGDHTNKVKNQIESSILPICDTILEFDTLNLNSEGTIISIKLSNQIGETIIDKTNKTIEITVKANANLERLSPKIQTSVGACIYPKSRETTDFSNGAVNYTITSEDGKTIETWKISISQETTSINGTNKISPVIYPNPTLDYLYLSNTLTDKLNKVEIFDSSGRLCLVSQSDDLILDTSTLSAGLYNIQISLKTGDLITQKIIKK